MGVNEIVEKLRSEEARLKQQMEKLQVQVRNMESELSQVQGALVALGQKPAGKASGKPIKPAASKREIIAAISEVLHEQGVMETNALRELVEGRMANKGRSRQGFAGRFAEAIEDPRFVETPGGWRLNQDSEHEGETQASMIAVDDAM